MSENRKPWICSTCGHICDDDVYFHNHDAKPCDTCDFAPSLCGRDIENCMARKEHRKGAGVTVVHMASQRIIKYGDYRDEGGQTKCK